MKAPPGWRLLTPEEYEQPAKQGIKFWEPSFLGWSESNNWAHGIKPAKGLLYITPSDRANKPSKWPKWDRLCKNNASSSSPS